MSNNDRKTVFLGINYKATDFSYLITEYLNSFRCGVELKLKDLKTNFFLSDFNDPPAVHSRIAFSALTLAEYFRDQKEGEVFLFVDDLLHFEKASQLLNLNLRNDEKTLRNDVNTFEERIASTKKSSLTSFRILRTNIDERLPSYAKFETDIFVSQQTDYYPFIDPLCSNSKLVNPNIIGEEHYNIVILIRQLLQIYQILKNKNPDELSKEEILLISQELENFNISFLSLLLLLNNFLNTVVNMSL